MKDRGLFVKLRCYRCEAELELWYDDIDALSGELENEILDMGWEEIKTGVYVCDNDRNYN